MSKPTEEELETALKMSAQMRDKKIDPFYIAKSLLSHNSRIKYLEEIMKAADRYINRGMSEQEKTHLIRTIEKAKDEESLAEGETRSSFGLE
ncbi:MAG TPA: hypothetical protein ENJ87_05365 [Gammaproteobacteria bacterium]|nr:hypothetical protein [Gammaproteobacteria bacterium]